MPERNATEQKNIISQLHKNYLELETTENSLNIQ